MIRPFLLRSITAVIILCFCACTQCSAQTIDINGPAGSGNFGRLVYVLANGNFVVTDPLYDDGAVADVGAVYLYNGNTLALISMLKGDQANDKIGNTGIYPLPNGNFLVQSPYWHGQVGAVTFCNGNTGLSGTVSSSNSLVGSHLNDLGYLYPITLSNGNYVLYNYSWQDGTGNIAGAVTWGSGTTGVSGVIGSSNSLVGTSTNQLAYAKALYVNGNYVIGATGSATGIGAIVWCNGNTGRTGVINNSIALTGNSANDRIGPVYPLKNGSFLAVSPEWDNGATPNVGAITLCSGTSATIGVVSAANSIIGTQANDSIGSDGITELANGNYLIFSRNWNNGAIVDAGACTWRASGSATTGTISAANSLVGSHAYDYIGESGYVSTLPLPNGNYVLVNQDWDNGSLVDAGAVTYCNGSAAVTGALSAANSLVGTTSQDLFGAGMKLLTNGNYMVMAPYWDNGAVTDVGAVTWCNGSTGLTGTISSSNSITGIQANDMYGALLSTRSLTNGNFVVGCPDCDNGAIVDAGAVTWINGTTGLTGTFNNTNSILGTNTGDYVGATVMALKNGHYVVGSAYWDKGPIVNAGAITWCDGTHPTTGSITASNSLTGSQANDYIGSFFDVRVLNSGNFYSRNPGWANGAISKAGAATWFNGNIPTSGTINNCNSILGGVANGGNGITVRYNDVYDFMVAGRPSENIVSVFYPTGEALAIHQDTYSGTVSGTDNTPLIASAGCRIIAALTPNGANPVNGTVDAEVWVEPSVPANNAGLPFVARHYQITPASGAATATSRVTLYFTQQEFTDFNNHPGSALNLPTGPADATGIANLRVVKFSGISSDGSGFPDTYPGPGSVINPADADIVWNSLLSRWEVSFNVTGFSGFIIQTNVSVTALTLLEFKGLLVNDNAELSWKTTNEQDVKSYELERSTDGLHFQTVTLVNPSNQPGNHDYAYTDPGISALGQSVIYYRLKEKFLNGNFSYSLIVPLYLRTDNVVTLAPNPAGNATTLRIESAAAQLMKLSIYDASGRLIQQSSYTLVKGVNSIPVSSSKLPTGIYQFEVQGEFFSSHLRLIKE